MNNNLTLKKSNLEKCKNMRRRKEKEERSNIIIIDRESSRIMTIHFDRIYIKISIYEYQLHPLLS